ncbi:hypothetical protein KRP22_012378 [Phytophthora ramorum]|nr:hypothetical protein KRP22_787 [Phytophthora ramorum]
MQTLPTFLAVVLLVSINLAKAENCTVLQVYNALQPLASDNNFATCQTDSNYTLLSFASPSLNQTAGFCSSSACQALLNTTLSSGLLPDCEVVLGLHALNLTDAVSIAAKCSLHERAVSKAEGDDALGHTADNVVTVVGHSVPMDELADIMALLRE